jgi:hypothetical protein
MPWNDASPTATNLSHLNPAPLTARHQVAAREGHFYNLDGKRVRFLGVNLAWSACFPDKADAPIVAARMRKLGINLVRMHNLDVGHAPRGIFNPQFPDLQHLDADQQDRLDFFIYQLAQHGVYSDINLHVGRKLSEADGLPDAKDLPSSGKLVNYFYPRAIELHEKFAADLMGHFNPYTKARYADDPAIAFIELTNENSLVSRAEQIKELPAPYRTQLIQDWNAFLKAKYPDTQTLRESWFGEAEPLGENLLANAPFAAPDMKWFLEKREGMEAGLTVEQSTPVVGGAVLHAQIEKVVRPDWFLQLHLDGLNLSPGQTYTLSFWAKSEAPRALRTGAKMDREPWQVVGLTQNFQLVPEWKRYSATFRAADPIPNHSRISFTLGASATDVWLADVQLRSGDGSTLEAGQTMEQGNIALPPISSSAQGQDALRFLSQFEIKYAERLRDFLKNTVKAQQPIINSQASFGGVAGLWRESKMDVMDIHAYWNHPTFPAGKWDAENWRIGNRPMTEQPESSTLLKMAPFRYAGKPFTVTEYHHPSPSDYQAEMMPLLAAFAARQDWDALVLFDYNDNRENWARDFPGAFFRMDANPAVLAFFPLAANIFLRGDVPPVPQQRTLQIPIKDLPDVAAPSVKMQAPVINTLHDKLGLTAENMLDFRWATKFVDEGKMQVVSEGAADAGSTPVRWRGELDKGGTFVLDTPRSKAVVSVHPAQNSAPFSLNGWQLEIGETRHHFAVASLTSLDDLPIETSARVLLTLAGSFENSGMQWNEARDSVGTNWGSAPVLAEAVPAQVRLKTTRQNAKVWALDATGARLELVPASWENGELRFAVTENAKTVWYEIAGEN